MLYVKKLFPREVHTTSTANVNCQLSIDLVISDAVALASLVY